MIEYCLIMSQLTVVLLQNMSLHKNNDTLALLLLRTLHILVPVDGQRFSMSYIDRNYMWTVVSCTS